MAGRGDGTEKRVASRGTWVIYLHRHQISEDGESLNVCPKCRQPGVQVFDNVCYGTFGKLHVPRNRWVDPSTCGQTCLKLTCRHLANPWVTLLYFRNGEEEKNIKLFSLSYTRIQQTFKNYFVEIIFFQRNILHKAFHRHEHFTSTLKLKARVLRNRENRSPS